MSKYRILIHRVLAVLVLVGLVIIIYLLWARPYQLRWGATDEEVSQRMPGDELNLTPNFLATRAITIQGTPDEIWPWLLQMGYGRAGFYGYDIMENLGSPYGIHSAESILPELQHFTLGDEVPISPAGGLEFYAIKPNQYLIWSGEKGWGGFTWALYPFDETHTRLVSRIRWSYSLFKPGQAAIELFTEFSDHLAVRKILQGIKGRVEGQSEPMAQANTEFLIYLASALIFAWAIILNLTHTLAWQRWLAGFIAGVAWLIIWYAPVPTWSGVLIELPVLWNLRVVFSKTPLWRG
jgi:hypothetical protein